MGKWECHGCSKSGRSQESHGSKSMKGGEWLGLIAFDPHAERNDADIHFACCYHLHEMLYEAKGYTQYDPLKKILQWVYYKCHIEDTSFWRHHYLLLKAEDGWWSVEKTNVGIHLRRSSRKENIRDFDFGDPQPIPRKGVVNLFESTESNSYFCRIGDLIDHIQKSLKGDYNSFFNNCQQWARETCLRIIETKWWRIPFVEMSLDTSVLVDPLIPGGEITPT